MKLLGVVVLMLLPGCSLLFQKHLPDGYAYRSEPECSTTSAWWIIDLLDMASSMFVAIAESTRSKPDETLVVASIGEVVLDGMSAGLGHRWAKQCERARPEYERRQEAREAAEADRRQERADAARAPRGAFCASSPTMLAASMCTREREDCERARDAALAAVPDISACLLVEAVWCFAHHRCAVSEAACNAAREAAGGEACAEER